ncbi:MAG: hypothetical protein H6701_00795 [Myxococcales bacterium]|nr:hypothetical protein [Myxococcales bacterium]
MRAPSPPAARHEARDRSRDFGFTTARPSEADIVWDVRFLPNPQLVGRAAGSAQQPRVAACDARTAPPRRRSSTASSGSSTVLPGAGTRGRATSSRSSCSGRHRSVALAERVAAHSPRGRDPR